ncbi:D-alanyl-D-alanine carboxypeptidase family protein [Bacillus sp. OV322]|uniref:D-alanyl-D-alanine carboxypeptidase family protein n=1 Tax=Bacillus sp. OV322 TaxID=1882764 RepID=UPI00210D6E09|nr:D-alanyl-D-alanine carboxypeptidase family protein [Bacillus sp. OV322]
MNINKVLWKKFLPVGTALILAFTMLFGLGGKHVFPGNAAKAEELHYTAAANLNIRTGPSTSYKKLGTVKKGTLLNIKGTKSNGWYKLIYSGQTGYASGKYIKSSFSGKGNSIHVTAKPDSISVLVNKNNKLPDTYTPKDLVYTSVPFTFKEKTEKRKMRKEASLALSKLFAGAKKQNVNLLGVSAYRSHSTQVGLFNYYVQKDGYEKASTYSALPGTSEHETGLAIDVTGGNGKCAAQDCFGYTKEAKWLGIHAEYYGFIIRYPKGKEAITGYKYEPWHLRYTGKSAARYISGHHITLEEYSLNAVSK